MNLIDKLKLKLCGDWLSVASLQMEVEDLQLENEELKQKNKTLSNNNSSYSKTWEDMFYKDWAEEIYQYEMKQELIEENTKLYSQLQDLAKVHEEMKQNYQEKIHLKNLRIIELNSSNDVAQKYCKLFGKNISNLLNTNHQLGLDLTSKDSKITTLSYNNNFLEKRNKELENIQEEYNLLLYEYQRLKGVKENFARTQEEYVNQARVSYDLGAEESIENVKLHYEKMIVDLTKQIDELSKNYQRSQKANSPLMDEIRRLQERNNSLNEISDKKTERIISLTNTIRSKDEYIKLLKSEKDNLQKSTETILQQDNSKITRNCREYDRFKKSVLKRDNYTCQCCGSTEAPNVHHQYSFAEYNYLGAKISNGIVLCKDCHKKYHSIYGYGKNNNPFTFAQFIRDYGKVMQSNLDSVADSECVLEGK